MLITGTFLGQTTGAFSLKNFVTPQATPTPQLPSTTSRPKKNTKLKISSIDRRGITDTGELITSGEQSRGQILASTEFNLIGLVGTASPSNQTVPKNTPTIIQTSIQVPDGQDPAAIISQLNSNYRIRGELSGPSFSSPRPIEVPIGQQIPIPPMPIVGDHVLQNLRIVDTTNSTNNTIAPVSPDSVGINVIDNILVTQVNVTEMTYEQIVQSGINLGSANYNYYNFVLGLGTSSGTVPIQIPVAMPTVGGQQPVVGNPVGGVTVDGVSVPLPEVVPVMLQGETADGGTAPIEMPGGGGGSIPGVIVFPGRIGLLHQFFEAIVIVANNAPNGTPLVVTNLRAKAKLPDAGTPNDPTDDPLKIAETQQGGVQSQRDIHGLGPDGRYGTADDTTSFNPGQSGQAPFLLEGLKEGLHTVNFDISGTLQGLPGGNITLRGSVPGAVLVRDAQFGVTFTHPSVVRAGQEYDLGLTVFNSGRGNINGVVLSLRGNGISGAELIDTEEKTLTQTIPPGGSGTVKWRLRSTTTGQVTASYVKVGEGISAGLNLVTGVGDRNVPLSPDSLILPDAVQHLPSDVVEAARQMLGQAWSVATAPRGSLPSGVLPVDKQTVVGKAIELGWAGLRMQFHEERNTSLRTLLRDWLGENQSNSSTGFADALRNTVAGYYFFDTVGTKFYESLNNESQGDFHKKLVDAESSRSAFISALVSHNSGQQILGAKIISPTNQSVGTGSNPGERFGDLRTGASLKLLQSDPHNITNNARGNLLVVSKPASGNWILELNGWTEGTADVSILAPTTGKNYRQLIFSGIAVTPGKRYRVTIKSSGTTAPVVEEFVNGAFRPANLPFTSYDVSDPNPAITGVIQVTDEVIEGGDNYGRLVGILFSKPMTKTSVEAASRYQLGGGELVSDPSQMIGRLIKPTSAYQNFGERFSIIALDNPIGPFVKRNLTINGLTDKTGKAIAGLTKDIEMRVSPRGRPPGGYMTGRVMQADGTPVPNAGVYYRREIRLYPCGPGTNVWETLGFQKSDENGNFVFDYVREDRCEPLTVLFQHTLTNSEKTIVSNIAYHGQHVIFNAVFLARGNIQGTVTSGGVPLVNANVSILSELDPLNNKLVKTNAQGFYSATGIPVGGVTVKAVGTGNYSLSSGIAAGNIDGPNATATVNVTTQNVSGIIKGKVLDNGNGQAPVRNAVVVAKAFIPGFITTEPIPVGYSYTDDNGAFNIEKLPIGNVFISAFDQQRGASNPITVQLTEQNTRVENVLLLVSNGFGRVTGRVLNELGQVIPNAVVQEGAQAVRSDSSGKYVLPQTREGNVTISATDPVSTLSGSTTVSVLRNEDTNNADIIIRRPANLNGQVFISQNGTTSPLAQVYVTVDGRRIVKTDAQGRYTLNNVESGRDLTIRFVHPQGKLFVNTNVFLNPGETLSRNATFKPARVYGKITQPDGLTPVVTGVNFKTSTPNMRQGIFFGLPEETTLFYQTTTDGLYSFESLNPIDYRLSSSNVFFPVPVSRTGILPPNANLEINLSLVNTLAGKVHGHIFQPDGTTPVGAGVKVSLGGGSLADVTVRTDAEGYYEFAEVFAEGSYALTATDPSTGRTNRTYAQVKKNEDIEVDLRLLGRGKLRVKVVDGGGVPLQTGSIEVTGTDYPRDERYIELTPGNNGVFEFTNLNEGNYAVSALYMGLGGRGAAAVTLDGTTEITIQVQAVGTITGRVYMPDGTTRVGLADVRLTQNGRTIGLITTDDSEENRGGFNFDYVPTGEFTIEVFDNRTGRKGKTAGQITTQGENADVSINLLALGTVVGRVTSNGTPAAHALVNLSADGSGISGTSRIATTDSEGRFRFPGIPVGHVYVTVSDGPGGLSGQSQGTVSGTIEPLPETVIDVALTPSATITGTVYKFGGSQIYAGVSVRVTSGNFRSNTTTDANGRYRIEYVPLGTINVRTEAPAGYDRGKSEPIISNVPGGTVTADVTMTGVGTVNGTALGSNGSPLSFGKVTFTNLSWNEGISVIAPVQPDGTYSMNGLPTGDFNLKLTVPEVIGVGTANDTLVGAQTLTKNLQLEPAGKVFGSVKAMDGTSPAVGADVELTLFKQGETYYSYRFVTHTDSSGNWEIANLPLGTISIRFSDANSNGVARLYGLNLNTNGQELNTGAVVLDNAPISVASVTPPNGAVNVSQSAAVQILFSEAFNPSTISSSSIRLKKGTSSVSAQLSISNENRTVTLTPSPLLEDMTLYTLEITTAVRDVNDIPLDETFVSVFTTADETAPVVDSTIPTYNTNEVPLNQIISVTFDEALGENQISDIVKVAPVNAPGNFVTGTYAISADRKTVTFTPSLLDSYVEYQIRVTGQKDIFGNTQTVPFVSRFRTVDVNPPQIYSYTIDSQAVVEGLIVENARPLFDVGFSDESGINTANTKLYLARQGEPLQEVAATVSQYTLRYQPPSVMEAGQYVTKAVVTDTSGNESATPEITFTINPQIPELFGVYQNGGWVTGNGVVTVKGRNLITQFAAPDDSARGLLAEYSNPGYYSNDPRLYFVRTDGEINFDSLGETTAPYFTEFSSENITWRGKVVPLHSEDYNFTFELSGGARIYIGENLIIDESASANVRQVSGSVTLEAGQAYDIRIEQFGGYGYRRVSKLYWSSPSQTLEIVPQAQLRPALKAIAPTVLFGGSPATVIGAVSVDSYDLLTVLTPPRIEETVDVEVQTENGTLSLPNAFTYYEDPYSPHARLISPPEMRNIAPPNKVSVTFDEPLAAVQDFNNILTVSSYDLSNYEYLPVAGNVTIDETNRRLTFVPLSPFTENARYKISVRNQRDPAGNVNIYESSSEFTTTDLSPPVIDYVYPVDQSTIVNRKPLIEAYFSDYISSIDEQSMKMILDGVDITNQADRYYSRISYMPSAPLSLGTHTVTFRAADLGGNSVETTTTFTVEADTQPPVINDFSIANQPAVDGVQIRYRQPTIYVNFNDNGTVPYNGQKMFLGPQGGTLSPVSVYNTGGTSGGSLYYWTPQNLDFGFYTVRVELIDDSGNVTTRSVNFEIVDLEIDPPFVTAYNPAYDARGVPLNSPVVVTFNEPLDPNQNFAEKMTVRNESEYEPVGGTYSLNGTGDVLTFTPNQPFVSDARYRIEVRQVLDVIGNESYSYSSQFWTIDTVAPQMEIKLLVANEQIDLNNARIYSRTPKIFMYCSDDSGINMSTFSFTLDGANLNLGSCQYVTYNPPQPLSIGVHTITAQVADVLGNVRNITQTFEIVPDPGMPFAVESDTVMLWNLDVLSCSEDCIATDSGPYNIGSEYYSYGSPVAGRFNGGAGGARFKTSINTQILSFGNNPFSIEGWFKYRLDPENPPQEPYVIWSRGNNTQKEFTLTLLPSGDLRAQLFNSGGVVWETILSRATFDLTDGEWHSIAMTVERGASPEQNQLKLYADGELRMSGLSPNNFGAVRTATNSRFFLGGSIPSEMRLDEIRISNTARTAEQIRKNFDRQEMGLVVLRTSPAILQQGGDTEIAFEGYNLDDVSATVTTTNGVVLPVTAEVLSATSISTNIRFSTDAGVPLGDALLTLTRGAWTTTVPLRVVNQQPFTVEAGTLLLWHLDEANGPLAQDSGPYAINATAYYSVDDARFGRAREYDIEANTNPAVLNLGGSSFTVESWFKCDDCNDATIFGKGDIDANSEAFALDWNDGVIRARLRDSLQVIWEAKTPFAQINIADNKWHYISMVVSRGAAANENRLLIYVDGIERANVQSPANFGNLRNNISRFTAGSYNVKTDEVRILNFARTTEQIAETWLGFGSGFSSSAAAKNNKKAVAVQTVPPKPDIPKPDKPLASSVPASGEQSVRIVRPKERLTINKR